MRKLLLDSDVAIRVIRSHPESVRRLRALPHSSWAISAMTAYEIHKGIAKRPGAASNKVAFEFLASSSIEVLGERVAMRAATIHQSLRARGITIGTADEFIAAQALEINATLVTNNTRHFVHVPGLKLESWL